MCKYETYLDFNNLEDSPAAREDYETFRKDYEAYLAREEGRDEKPVDSCEDCPYNNNAEYTEYNCPFRHTCCPLY